jgi:hypothetical protein
MTTILLPSVLLITLALYAFIASQPLFYLMALGTASERLSAPAYIELRQRIDQAIQNRLRYACYAALLFLLVLLVLAALRGSMPLLVTGAVALVALVTDLALAIKGNIPINARINTWTPEQYPTDWDAYRAQWLGIYRRRQVSICIGLTALLIGTVSAL